MNAPTAYLLGLLTVPVLVALALLGREVRQFAFDWRTDTGMWRAHRVLRLRDGLWEPYTVTLTCPVGVPAPFTGLVYACRLNRFVASGWYQKLDPECGQCTGRPGLSAMCPARSHNADRGAPAVA